MSTALSVVIASYNRCASLLRLLDSIESQALRVSDYEVIVVLDGCNDGSAAALGSRPWPFSLRVIEQPNSGASAARNAGVAEAIGEVVLFLDDDVSLLPGALSVHIQAHEGTPNHLVLGHFQPAAGAARPYRRRIAAWMQALVRVSIASGGNVPPSWVYAGHFSMPRWVFPAGGFREDLRRFEDTELAVRLAEGGVGAVYRPEARAILHEAKPLATQLADAAFEGELMVALWRMDPATSARLTRLDRRRRSAWQARWFAMLAEVPVPRVVARVVWWLSFTAPGFGRLFPQLRLHAYLRGAHRKLRDPADWLAFLNRPGTLR